MADKLAGVSRAALDDVHALLECGVPFGRLLAIRPHDLSEHQLHDIAKSWVASSDNERGAQYSLDVAGAVLARSSSALETPGFSEKMLEGLESDAPEELKDPLFYTLMRDPVVLSSGVVVDRSTALTEAGDLRFHHCPFTREQLKRHVYPILFLRERLVQFARKRIDQIFTLIDKAMPTDSAGGGNGSSGNNLELAAKAVDMGCKFLKEVGRNTYANEAQRMNSEKLRMLEAQGMLEPAPWMETFEELLALARLQSQSDPQQDVLRRAEGKTTSAANLLLGKTPPDVTGAEAWLAALCQLVARLGEQEQGAGALSASSVLQLARLLMHAARLSREPSRLAVARTTIYLAMRKNGASESDLSSYLMEEGVSQQAMEDVLRQPSELKVRRKDDRRSSDEWHHSGTLRCGPTAVRALEISCEWRDQGWGNTKGAIAAQLHRNGSLVCSADVFGTCMAAGPRDDYAPVARAFGATDAVVASAASGDELVFKYKVGGGGGHELYIRNFVAKLVLAAPVAADAGGSAAVDLPPPWMAPLLGLAAEVTEVEYTDSDGDHIRMCIEDGQLIKYVNGTRKVGGDDLSGVVTRLRLSGRRHLSDQHRWGGEVPDDQLLDRIAELAERVGVPHNISDERLQWNSDSEVMSSGSASEDEEEEDELSDMS